MVFGHINASYGQEDVVLDKARRCHDEILNQWSSYWTLVELALLVLFARLPVWMCGLNRFLNQERVTTVVNASIVSGSENELANKPVLLRL